tara:strand:+ start:301 stop:540 length:240 start_codon:yes stop_codon:yes gene_type:complete
MVYDYIYESDNRKGKPENPTVPEVFDATIDPYLLQRTLEERIDYNYIQEGKLVHKVVSTQDKVIIFFSQKNFVINLVQN